MKLELTDGKLEGIKHIRPAAYKDERGYFLETYSQVDFKNSGLNANFLQDNESKSTKGVLRGMHFQTKHTQGKLVRCIYGKVLDVAVDLRNSSATFGKWEAVILDGETKNMMYIPEGFAHGFLVVSEEAVFSYKCTDYYAPGYEGGIRWDDPNIGIDWRLDEYGIKTPLLSEKDQKLLYFKNNIKFF